MKLIKIIFPYVWVGLWLTLFVWFTKDSFPLIPVPIRILIIIAVIVMSTAWLLRLTNESDSVRSGKEETK